MRIFDELCPAPPRWTVDWDRIHAAFDWIRAMDGVAQDPVHHAEGDVATHTRMAAEALAALPEFRDREPADRIRLFATVLLHDVAKPFTSRTDADGRVTAHDHSRAGDLAARRILWRLGAPIAWREHVATLIRHHQVPFWTLDRAANDLDTIALRVSLNARNDDLATLARADILGRICTDTDQVLASIDLYADYCGDLGALDRPFPFPGDHARFAYFRTGGRDPRYAAFDDTTCTMTVLSGLPGAGKDTWVAAHHGGRPVISLDTLRAELGVKPTDDQAPVAAAARDQARALLRTGTSFIWNATNISRQQRERCIGLAAAYRARVEIVAVETSETSLLRRNRAREHSLPAAALERLIRRWETPDLTEAHIITHAVSR